MLSEETVCCIFVHNNIYIYIYIYDMVHCLVVLTVHTDVIQ